MQKLTQKKDRMSERITMGEMENGQFATIVKSGDDYDGTVVRRLGQNWFSVDEFSFWINRDDAEMLIKVEPLSNGVVFTLS